MNKVYIAGPYSKGDVVLNIQAAVHAANEVLKRGFTPFIPHLTHLWHMVSPKPYQEWLDYDMEWLTLCDWVLRIPGDSGGADKEVAVAQRLCIPVIFGLEAFLERFDAR